MKKMNFLLFVVLALAVCSSGLMAAPAPVATAAPTLAPTPAVEEGSSIAYPQPARGSITFSYKLTEAATAVNIYVYNLKGSQVAAFEAGAGIAGQNFDTFDTSKFSSGVYFYMIVADNAAGGVTKQKLSKFIVGR